jgi:hypothetical protein
MESGEDGLMTAGGRRVRARRTGLAAGLGAVLLACGPARLPAAPVEMGVQDDLTVHGTDGDKTDPDVELRGYSVFGTNASRAAAVVAGAGNAFVEYSVEVGSNLFVRGRAAVGSTNPAAAFVVGTNVFRVSADGDLIRVRNVPYSWPAAQGSARSWLRNDGAGNLAWAVLPPPAVVTFYADANTSPNWRCVDTLTELLNKTYYRMQVDLTGATQVRVVANITGVVQDGEVRAQYSTDGGTAWAYLDGVSGPSAPTGVGAPVRQVGLSVGAWVDLEAAARTDVMLRLVAWRPGGGQNCTIGLLALQFR